MVCDLCAKHAQFGRVRAPSGMEDSAANRCRYRVRITLPAGRMDYACRFVRLRYENVFSELDPESAKHTEHSSIYPIAGMLVRRPTS